MFFLIIGMAITASDRKGSSELLCSVPEAEIVLLMVCELDRRTDDMLVLSFGSLGVKILMSSIGSLLCLFSITSATVKMNLNLRSSGLLVGLSSFGTD